MKHQEKTAFEPAGGISARIIIRSIAAKLSKYKYWLVAETAFVGPAPSICCQQLGWPCRWR
jgi:hypothetical protein